MEANYEMTAIYRDADGNEFRYPVVKTASGWKLSGLVDIVFYLREATVAGGIIEFVDYVLAAPPGIRGCDFIQVNNAMRIQLPWPQKPEAPPTIKTESEDSRLHVATGGSWREHKQAHAEQRLAQERQNRGQARGELQDVGVDPAKIMAARQLNNEIAKAMRPHGRGQGLLIGKE